jgi:excisionase family DNA binding protein
MALRGHDQANQGPGGRGHPRRLSVEEAAPILGVSVFTVRKLIRRRAVPFYRVGRRVVLDPDDLERYLRQHRVEPRDGRGG